MARVRSPLSNCKPFDLGLPHIDVFSVLVSGFVFVLASVDESVFDVSDLVSDSRSAFGSTVGLGFATEAVEFVR